MVVISLKKMPIEIWSDRTYQNFDIKYQIFDIKFLFFLISKKTNIWYLIFSLLQNLNTLIWYGKYQNFDIWKYQISNIKILFFLISKFWYLFFLILRHDHFVFFDIKKTNLIWYYHIKKTNLFFLISKKSNKTKFWYQNFDIWISKKNKSLIIKFDLIFLIFVPDVAKYQNFVIFVILIIFSQNIKNKKNGNNRNGGIQIEMGWRERTETEEKEMDEREWNGKEVYRMDIQFHSIPLQCFRFHFCYSYLILFLSI